MTILFGGKWWQWARGCKFGAICADNTINQDAGLHATNLPAINNSHQGIPAEEYLSASPAYNAHAHFTAILLEKSLKTQYVIN